MFIDSDSAEIPFDPGMLMKPAFGEYARRGSKVPGLLFDALCEYLRSPLRQDLLASFERLARAIPTGIFDNAGIDGFMRRVFSLPGLSNDFRRLGTRLFLVATDLDSGRSVAFGAKGNDHVPISTAIQASAALPGLYPPVEIGGRWYVDGALKKTLHASVVLKEGAQLVICINPLVPFDAHHAAHERHLRQRRLVDGGLPVVLAQTFRAIIHSRMKTGLAKYDIEYRDADVILFEPSPDDADMFFTNVFSYADRRRLSELAYRRTREELLRRHDELAPKLARHGVSINRAVLADPHRTPGASHGTAEAESGPLDGADRIAAVRHTGRARHCAQASGPCAPAGMIRNDKRILGFCYPLPLTEITHRWNESRSVAPASASWKHPWCCSMNSANRMSRPS
jgi:NTE family protein